MKDAMLYEMNHPAGGAANAAPPSALTYSRSKAALRRLLGEPWLPTSYTDQLKELLSVHRLEPALGNAPREVTEQGSVVGGQDRDN
jgi:hypothetical protein